MNEILCTILEGCINSYINSITKRIDNYNHYNNKGEDTDIKSCITKRGDDKYIINAQYNPKVILGIIDIKDNTIENITLNRRYYPAPSNSTKVPQFEYELNKDFRNSLLKINLGM